jgi:hypothetical protein
VALRGAACWRGAAGAARNVGALAAALRRRAAFGRRGMEGGDGCGGEAQEGRAPRIRMRGGMGRRWRGDERRVAGATEANPGPRCGGSPAGAWRAGAGAEERKERKEERLTNGPGEEFSNKNKFQTLTSD